MLSILIPTYNYNITKLVHEVYKQIILLDVEFEILCYDDGSTNKEVIAANKEINSLEHTTYYILDKNIGRSAIRNLLAKEGKFEWLLFLDADVLPKESDFIATYLQAISEETQVIYGGIVYQEEEPQSNELLRWKYGKFIESKSANLRASDKYKNLLFSNTLIKESLFKTIQFSTELIKYGHEDTLLAYSLQKTGANVLHLENTVFHNGLDTNKQYLIKTREALNNLNHISKQNLINSDFVKMLRFHKKLKRFKLDLVLAIVYKQFKNKMENNLLSSNSSLKTFNVYRLSYFCYINK